MKKLLLSVAVLMFATLLFSQEDSEEHKNDLKKTDNIISVQKGKSANDM